MLDLSVFCGCDNVRDWVLLQLSEVLCVLTTYLTYKRPNIAQPSSSFFSQATLADELVTFTASVQQDAFVLFVWLLPNTFHPHIYLLCYGPNIRHISILFIVSTSFHPQWYFAHRNKQSYSCHCWWTGGWQPFTKILGADVRKVEFSTSDGQLHITSSPSFAANRSKLMNTSFSLSRFLQIQSRAEQTQTHRPRRLRHQCLPSLQKYTRFCAFLA